MKRWESLLLRLQNKVKTANFLPFFFSFFSILFGIRSHAQPYDPGPDQEGSKAIPASSALFRSWATEVKDIRRGWKNKAIPDSGRVSAGDPGFATGPAMANGVVSLGDGGTITLGFRNGISNGAGPDFAVFENGFGDEFLELAIVEVSSDGNFFVPFPSVSLTQTNQQVWSFGNLDARNLYNLAGKYRLGFGTPFDLEELKNEVGLNINQIRFVRIRDVVGSIDPELGTRDSKGNLINEPYPTQFETGGFDLDAIGVIHEAGTEPPIFPAIVSQGGSYLVSGLEVNETFRIADLNGRTSEVTTIQSSQEQWIANYPKGFYIVQFPGQTRRKPVKILIQ